MKRFKNQQKISLFLLTIFLLVFVFWIFDVKYNPYSPTQIEPSSVSQTNLIAGIARVVDGDTIAIDKSRIRLSKIDAPEMKQKCLDRNHFEYKCGETSKAFLQKLAEGKRVECHYEEKDMYNRYLGNCLLNDISINHEMVKSGMAVIYNLKDADEDMKAMEEEAQNKKLGIWQGAFEEPKEYRRKNRHKAKVNS